MVVRYYMDFEFLEGTQDKRCLGIKYGQTKPTIDMISVGLVSEDNREYYAVSKDFNLKEAWNRCEVKVGQVYGDMRNKFPNGIRTKIHWIRKHVLNTIFIDFLKLEKQFLERQKRLIGHAPCINSEFSYSNFKRLLNRYGKTNKQIAEEIINFTNPDLMFHVSAYNNSELKEGGKLHQHFEDHSVTSDGEYYFSQPKFYTYYGAYDHVVFCWLFGKMNNLPKGFQKYTIDLKQELDNIASTYKHVKFQEALENLKNSDLYPKKNNEHNALADARWNKELHEFIERMKEIENRVNSGTITYKAFKKGKRSASR